MYTCYWCCGRHGFNTGDCSEWEAGEIIPGDVSGVWSVVMTMMPSCIRQFITSDGKGPFATRSRGSFHWIKPVSSCTTAITGYQHLTARLEACTVLQSPIPPAVYKHYLSVTDYGSKVHGLCTEAAIRYRNFLWLITILRPEVIKSLYAKTIR